MPRRSKSYFVPGKKIDISLLVYYLPRYKIHRYLYIHMCVCVCFWHTFSKSILAFFPSHYKSSAHPRFGQALHARLITISQCCISKQMSDHHKLKILFHLTDESKRNVSFRRNMQRYASSLLFLSLTKHTQKIEIISLTIKCKNATARELSLAGQRLDM